MFLSNHHLDLMKPNHGGLIAASTASTCSDDPELHPDLCIDATRKSICSAHRQHQQPKDEAVRDEKRWNDDGRNEKRCPERTSTLGRDPASTLKHGVHQIAGRTPRLSEAGRGHAGPILLALAGLFVRYEPAMAVALIWLAHCGFDRALGYGLKYEAGFGFTHLGHIGRAA
jgi:hypothetical protein